MLHLLQSFDSPHKIFVYFSLDIAISLFNLLLLLRKDVEVVGFLLGRLKGELRLELGRIALDAFGYLLAHDEVFELIEVVLLEDVVDVSAGAWSCRSTSHY